MAGKFKFEKRGRVKMAARKRAWSEESWVDDVSDEDLVRIGELYEDQ